jgi:hypothetical protein
MIQKINIMEELAKNQIEKIIRKKPKGLRHEGNFLIFPHNNRFIEINKNDLKNETKEVFEIIPTTTRFNSKKYYLAR